MIGGKYEPVKPSAGELFERTIDVGQNYDNLLDRPVQRSDTDASGSSIGDVKPIQYAYFLYLPPMTVIVLQLVH